MTDIRDRSMVSNCSAVASRSTCSATIKASSCEVSVASRMFGGTPQLMGSKSTGPKNPPRLA